MSEVQVPRIWSESFPSPVLTLSIPVTRAAAVGLHRGSSPPASSSPSSSHSHHYNLRSHPVHITVGKEIAFIQHRSILLAWISSKYSRKICSPVGTQIFRMVNDTRMCVRRIKIRLIVKYYWSTELSQFLQHIHNWHSFFSQSLCKADAIPVFKQVSPSPLKKVRSCGPWL